MEIILPHTYFLADKDLENINIFQELQGNDEKVTHSVLILSKGWHDQVKPHWSQHQHASVC